MSDNPIDDLKEDDAKNTQELEEAIDDTKSSPQQEGQDTPSSENDSEKTHEENSENDSETKATEEDEDECEYDGIASAYKKEKKKKEKDPSDIKEFAPPGRGKWDGVKKEGKLIGEVLYDQMIAFFEWLMKNSVDLVLDFADYALFKCLKGLSKTPKQNEEKEKKTVFDYGREIEKGYADNAAKGIAFYKQALKEVLDNIERNKRGEPLEWKVFKNEPKWFAEAIKLEKEASLNPDSDAAKKWERFKNSDKIIEGKLGNEAIYRIIATRIATFNEAMSENEFELPENVSKKLKEMEKILQQDDKKISADDLKIKMAEKIKEMRTMVTGGGFVNQTINAKLDEMQSIATSDKDNVADLKKGFNKAVEQIKEVNPTPEHIKTMSREDYEKITKHLDIIREKYKDNPEKKKEIMAAYVNNIIATLNEAQEHVIKYEEASRLSKNNRIQQFKHSVYGVINRVGDSVTKDGNPLFNLKTRKEKAENGIKTIKSAINDFMIEGKKISEYDDAVKRNSAPETSNSAMLQQMSSFFRRGR